ncbi:transcriptional regulator with PAS, ATPase and Fis domain [Caldalkalibacillus uzonensis]|uniref:Transcriptional regulator with PAS, ATPase and Fis domain n=1 Tax=Caldalkalibacillus uzonensis TaxID=353224 RepID=A0ABU0CNP5_9BACI|nr:sigma 54-interacting transcriptional regulator [Caldalkalibacillus uzonensis]MDQ0338032.1 transcriptional regulator with PAS, ATPase and Fis domain [Caldalkalibacillus uzonensis]
MTTLLYEIRDSIRKLIETTKSLIDFDFSVVDENLLRIVGTGRYEKYIGLNLPANTATDYVMKTGKPLIMYNPLEHTVCISCPVRNICLKDTMMIYPIKKNDKVIGAITIGAFTDELKEKQQQMEQNLSSFLENLADFIASKASERETAKRISTILNTVDSGIILTDYTGRITVFNEVIRNLFHDDIHQHDNIRTFLPDHDVEKILKKRETFENRECNLGRFYGDKRVFVTAKPIHPNQDKTEILYIFKDHNDMGNIAYKLLADYSYFSIGLDHIKSSSKLMEEVKNISIRASRTDSNVLIQGESGTGKELFARLIHQMSDRKNGPFIAVNCAAIPENLIESELFGYEDGAFTGAKKGGKPGKFELANNGTLFLDEIGDLPLHLQPKLLRAIEYGYVERVGGVKPINLNTRIIAATNRDLEKMIEEDEFREDLYYRLNVIPIHIPPLRKRREDILVLANHFLSTYSRKFSKQITGFSEEVEKVLLIYHWPGNVRELENTIEYAIHVESSDVIQYESLPAKLKNVSIAEKDSKNCNLKQLEQKMIEGLLQQYGTTLKGKTKIAEELGISLSTLYRRIRRMDT